MERIRLPTLIAGLSAATFLVVGLAVARACEGPAAVVQPVAFDHSLHVGDVQLECAACHGSAGTNRHAGLPSIRVCAQCHSGPSDRPELAKVSWYAARGEQIPFVQVNRYPGHVYFSHRVHVSLAEMSCGECHVDVARMPRPYSRPDASMQSMEDCMSCHTQYGATLECLACHQ